MTTQRKSYFVSIFQWGFQLSRMARKLAILKSGLRPKAVILAGIFLFATAGCTTQVASKTKGNTVTPVAPPSVQPHGNNAGVHVDQLIGVGAPTNATLRKLQHVVLEQIAEKLQYPSIAIAERAHGSAMVKIVIDRSGRILKNEILSSSKSAALDSEAIGVMQRIESFKVELSADEIPGAQFFSFNVPINFALDERTPVEGETATPATPKASVSTMSTPLAAAWLVQVDKAIYDSWTLPTNEPWKVTLHLKLGPNTEIHSVELSKSSGNASIDKRILNAASNSKPLPTLENLSTTQESDIYLCLAHPRNECNPRESTVVRALSIIIIANTIR